MPSDRQCCISTCPNSIAVSKVPVHKFPNPIRNSENFNRWKTIIGKHQLEGLSDEHISKYRRVCRTHFKTEHLCRFNRLSAHAVPTINIPAVPELNNTSSPQDEVKKPTADCEVAPAVTTIIDANVYTELAVGEVISEYEVVPVNIINDDDICTDIAAEEVISDYKVLPVSFINDDDICTDIAAEEVISDYKDEPEGNNTISIKDEDEKPTADCEVAPAVSTVKDADVCTDIATEEVISDYEVEHYTISIIDSPAVSSTVDAYVYTDVGAEEVISDHEGSNDCHETVIDSENLYDYFEKLLKIPSGNKPSLPAIKQRRINGSNDFHKTVTGSTKPSDCIKQYVEIPSRPNPSPPATEERRIKGSNDCIKTITESRKPKDCIKVVVQVPSRPKRPLLANEQRKINGSNACEKTITESEKSHDCIKEVLNIPSTPKPSLLANEQRKYNERILPFPAMHSHITCDNCKEPIVGFHYKCLSCANYNHCYKCEMQEAHPNHYMIRIPKLPELKVPENIIDDYCDTFKAIISSGADPKMCKSILRGNKSVNSNSKVCADYLTEEVKLSLRKKVSRVVKENAVGTGKRKIQMRQYTVKKKKMTVPTAIDNEPQTIREIGQNENDTSLASVNNNNSSVDHGKGYNNESMFTVATVDTDPVFIGVNCGMSDFVSELIIETTKDTEKTIYKYVDS